MDALVLQQLISQGESETVEFKSSFNVATIESLVAFANTKGGSVLVGVSDKGKIEGVQLAQETIAEWLNEIKSKTIPTIIPNVDIEEQNGQTIVVLNVAEYPVKPVSLKGRYFQRRANSNHPLSAVEISNLSLQSRNLSWDSYPAIGKTLEDID